MRWLPAGFKIACTIFSNCYYHSQNLELGIFIPLSYINTCEWVQPTAFRSIKLQKVIPSNTTRSEYLMPKGDKMLGTGDHPLETSGEHILFVISCSHGLKV